jgi:hypothetical protein
MISMDARTVTGRVVHPVFPDSCQLSLRFDKKAVIATTIVIAKPILGVRTTRV